MDSTELIVCEASRFKPENVAFFDHPLFDKFTEDIANAASDFHKTIDGYNPTKLVNLKSLASNLGLGSIIIKDESTRFGLNAYKFLGVSYAIAKEILGEDHAGIIE